RYDSPVGGDQAETAASACRREPQSSTVHRIGATPQGLRPGFEWDSHDLECLSPGRDILEAKMARRIGHRSAPRAEQEYVRERDRPGWPPSQHAAFDARRRGGGRDGHEEPEGRQRENESKTLHAGETPEDIPVLTAQPRIIGFTPDSITQQLVHSRVRAYAGLLRCGARRRIRSASGL